MPAHYEQTQCNRAVGRSVCLPACFIQTINWKKPFTELCHY